MKKLNLNSVIKVKLNDRGKDIFYHQYDELNRFIVGRGGKPIAPRYPEVDADGYSRFQLWDFMHVYGKCMMMGSPAVIEGLNIYVNDEDLEEANPAPVKNYNPVRKAYDLMVGFVHENKTTDLEEVVGYLDEALDDYNDSIEAKFTIATPISKSGSEPYGHPDPPGAPGVQGPAGIRSAVKVKED